jgi:predicted enzyme related to lactoylglutathione lyase
MQLPGREYSATASKGVVMQPRIEIGIDALDLGALSAFWSAALGYSVGDLDRAGVYLDLIPPTVDLPGLYFQQVTEKKRGKNRLHLDLYVEDPEATIADLVAIGAEVISPARTGSEGGWWRVLADPEGNEFCVCKATPAPEGVS